MVIRAEDLEKDDKAPKALDDADIELLKTYVSKK
jgi:hypothetical protein